MAGRVKRNIKWDQDTGNWYHVSQYDEDTTLDAVADWLESGGSSSHRALMGVCKCSLGTINNWLNPEHKSFKPKLKAVIEHYKGLLAMKADRDHHAFAIGEIKGDTRSINRRWDRYTNGFTVSFKPSDSYAHKVQCILKDLENGNIDGAEAREWIKTFASSDTEAALEKIEQILGSKDE